MSRGENIYKRKDGRWEGRYPKGRKLNGSIQYGYIYGRSFQNVRKELIKQKVLFTERNVELKKGYHGSFNSWVDLWLNQFICGAVKESTYVNYKKKLDYYVLPTLGKIPLQKIAQSNLENLVLQWDSQLSPSSIHLIFRIVKSCLNVAKEEGYILSNPAEKVVLPKNKKKPINALTKKQHTQVLTEARTHPHGLPIVIALETGMRIGEISALKWEDIDFVQELIHVKRTRQRILTTDGKGKKTKLVETGPKTEKSKRVIPLTSSLKASLLSAKKQALTPYVIENQGSSVEPRTINYRFNYMKNKMDLNDICFHSLRHTFATRCVELGISITTISALLGHSSTKMTLDTYTYSFYEDQREAMKKLSVFQ